MVGSGSAPSSAVTSVVGFVAVIVVFYFGYKLGTSGTQSSAAPSTINLHHQEAAMRDSANVCHKQLSETHLGGKHASAELRRLHEKHAKLVKTNDALYDDGNRLDKDFAACDGEQKDINSHVFLGNLVRKSKIRQLDGILEGLTQQVKAMEQKRGMRGVLLRQIIRRQRADYMHNLRRLGITPPGEEFEDELLTKWHSNVSDTANNNDWLGQIGNITQERQDSERTLRNVGMMPRERKRMEEKIRRWERFRFDEGNATHKHIFFSPFPAPSALPSTYDKPAFFGRVGNTEVSVGTRRNHRPVMKTATVQELVVRTALCAYRNRNPNFTYPNEFFRKSVSLRARTEKIAAMAQAQMERAKELGVRVGDVLPNGTRITLPPIRQALEDAYTNATVTRLSEVFDTPLLTFCTNCQSMVGTTAFHLACAGDMVDTLYGSADFWAARSMVRVGAAARRVAVRAAAKLGLRVPPGSKGTVAEGGGEATQRVVAIPFSRGGRHAKRCRWIHRYMPRAHYVWVKANFPNSSVPEMIPNNTRKQCYPDGDDVIDGVKALAKAQGIPKFDRILIWAPPAPANDEEVASLNNDLTNATSEPGTNNKVSAPGPVPLHPEAEALVNKLKLAGHDVVGLAAASAVQDAALVYLYSNAATDLLLNRHSTASKLLFEEWLLNKPGARLDPEGRVAFF